MQRPLFEGLLHPEAQCGLPNITPLHTLDAGRALLGRLAAWLGAK